MIMLLLNQDPYGSGMRPAVVAIIIILFALMLGPPLILTIIGFMIKKAKPERAKKLFIAAAIYLIIGLGTCRSWMG